MPAVVFKIQLHIGMDDCDTNGHQNLQEEKITTRVILVLKSGCLQSRCTNQNHEDEQQKSVNVVKLVVPKAAEHEVHLDED